MLFNSFIFAGFFVVVLALYRLVGHDWQNRLLLVASYVFYAAWDWRFCSLLLISTVVDYYVGGRLHTTDDERSRKRLLRLSMMTNLGILATFKYFNFFIDSATSLLSSVGLDASSPVLKVALPVGISFYTFQTMSYTIDIYRRRLEPVDSIRDFAVFVAYFPQLVAGPIERASNLLPRIQRDRAHSRQQDLEGLWLMLWGLFKKIVIADNAAIVVNEVFASDTPSSGFVGLVAVYAFALQIYCDFSGYSDIARGASKLLGIELMLNFEMPYRSQNPSEFWRRWHISLSTWLRDYLYIPLGGNRGGELLTYRNLLLTMTIGGLWHGAAWTFVAWGMFHGLWLGAHRYLSEKRPAASPTPVLRLLKQIGTFHMVCVGWLFFRAESFGQVFNFLETMVLDLTITSDLGRYVFIVVVLSAALLLLEGWHRSVDDPSASLGWHRGLGPTIVTGLVLTMIVLAPPAGGQFIYFQF
ncbi:MAG: MBOAT family protein [Actinomycetia bacterium]|nr:MBOAT family protein [Actinomycetes bacterium]